jgi:hypothetical protein
MYKLLLAAVAALALIAPTQLRAGDKVPVMIPADEEIYDVCGAGATVTGLDPNGDGFLAVKAGPGLNFRRIDKLYNGHRVILCDSKGDWWGIVYTKKYKDDDACIPHGSRRSFPYTGPCLSGWVHKRWLGDFAG